MLEDLAYAYADTSAATSIAINYGCLVLGGLIGGLTDRSGRELSRAPYFAFTGLLIAGLSLFGLIEVQFLVGAMVNRVLWLLLALELSALAVVGFLAARIALARSRHATGDGSLAFLAFIPVANLYLLFKARPADWPPSPADAGHALNGGMGVVLGLVAAAGSGLLDRAATASTERNMALAAESGDLDRAFLPDLLRNIAAGEATPQTVDEFTTLTSITPGDATLDYRYVVDLRGQKLSDGVRALVIEKSCSNEILGRVFRAGGTVTMAYDTPDGTNLLTVDMTEATCRE